MFNEIKACLTALAIFAIASPAMAQEPGVMSSDGSTAKLAGHLDSPYIEGLVIERVGEGVPIGLVLYEDPGVGPEVTEACSASCLYHFQIKDGMLILSQVAVADQTAYVLKKSTTVNIEVGSPDLKEFIALLREEMLRFPREWVPTR